MQALKFRVIISSIVLLLFVTGCSKYQQLLKSTNNENKYKMAMQYYDHKDYYRALQLYDQLLPIYRGTAKAEKIAYYYAYCYYEQGDYEIASYQFDTFVSSFPKSEKTEECAFMSAYCKYLEAPSPQLDQTPTKEAIKQLQLFINQYPNSTRIEECNVLLDKLRYILETKAYDAAALYLKIEDYVAAITSFNSLLQDYPDTKYKEVALYDILKANFKLASNSILSKKAERYQSTIEAYNNFKNNFPESNYMKESNIMDKIALQELTKYKNNNSEKL